MSEELNETTVVETTPPIPTSINDLKRKMQVNGIVQQLELYGAFLDIGVGVNALIHISQLGKEHVNRVADVLNVGDEVTVWIDKVDPEREQIMVSMIEPVAVEWSDLKDGQVYTGKVTRLEGFGAFIDVGAEREGLVHISELSHGYVKSPSEVLSVGDEVQVQVLGFSKRKRRIDLSIKALLEKPELTESIGAVLGDNDKKGKRRGKNKKTETVSVANLDFGDEDGSMPTAMEVALRSAMGDDTIDAITTPKRKQKGKRRKGGRTRAQQDDILNRTLQLQEEG